MYYSHYCDLNKCPDSMLAGIFAEFHDNGVANIVFSNFWIERLLKEPRFMAIIKHAAQGKIQFRDMHAPYGECYDLACLNRGRRPDMIADHIRALEYAADFGCKTYTVHIGAWDSVFFNTPNELLRPLVIESLEKLIPVAEKNDIAIAVENAFEVANTPDEVMYYVDFFKHQYLGCCFDCGHANVMEDVPGKVYGHHMLDVVWKGNVKNYNGAFEKMASAIVTCHLHDNNGVEDQHCMPGDGTVNWHELAEKLPQKAPRLRSIQSEVLCFANGYSIKTLVKKFRTIFPDWSQH